MQSCELCQREKPLQFHHLIPKRLHKKRFYRLKYDKEFLAHQGIWLCPECHRQLHLLFTHEELGRRYHTLEAILDSEKVQKFLRYIRKKK